MTDRPSRSGNLKLRILALGVLVLAAIQFVPYGRTHVVPAARVEPAWDRGETRTLFMQACGDCHSYETRWPWYSRVAPVSWLVQHDVDEGRSKFNVQEWGRAHNRGRAAADELEEGEMPLWYYTPLHPEARLSAADRQHLISGLTATFGPGDEAASHGNEHNGEERDMD
jgi:mono/diheme cytochrome c family protein